jgi:site-specific DNA recombinase
MAKSAAIYSRVSTSTGKQSTSRQVNELIIYAKSLGYKVSTEDIFEEFRSGYSKKSERVEMNKLLDLIRKNKNKYKAIFVSEISRIARDPKFGREIVDELTSYNIPVFVKNPALCSIDEDGKRSAMFNIIFQILLELANTEAEFMKLRIRSGVLDKVKNGHAVGGKIQPYGYNSVDKMLTINETEAEIVKRIFDWCVSGNGTKTIANKLNALKIPTKYNNLFDQLYPKDQEKGIQVHTKAIIWKEGTVYGILTNPIYKGKRRFIQHDELDSVETIHFEGKKYNLFDAPQIVTKEIWEKAQNCLKSNLKHSIRNKKFDYILKGLVTCAKCGSPYSGRMKTDGKDKFYMCSDRRAKTKHCKNPGIGIEMLESAVWTFIQFNTNIDNLLLQVDKKYNDSIDGIKNTRAEIESLTERIKKEEAQASRLKNLYVEGFHTYEEFKKKYTPLENTIKKYKKSIIDLEIRINSLEDILKSKQDLNEMDLAKKSLLKDRLMISKLINDLIDKISLLVIDRNWAIISFKYKYVDSNYLILLNRTAKLLIPITYDLGSGNDKVFVIDKKLKKVVQGDGAILEFDQYGRIVSEQKVIDEVFDFFSDEGNMGFREPLLWIPFT